LAQAALRLAPGPVIVCFQTKTTTMSKIVDSAPQSNSHAGPTAGPGGAAANGKPRLLPKHLADLRASGLSDTQNDACGFYSEKSAAKVGEILRWGKTTSKGRAKPGNEPAAKLGYCLVIPFIGPDGRPMCYEGADGKPVPYQRVKPDTPRRDEAGKPIKYESPAGLPNRVFFPPGTRAVLADPGTPLLLTEGEKKANLLLSLSVGGRPDAPPPVEC
jgi:hypothetical protein